MLGQNNFIREILQATGNQGRYKTGLQKKRARHLRAYPLKKFRTIFYYKSELFLLLLVTIFAKALFAFVCRNLMSLTFFSAGHSAGF
jgi:hypothetical protein